MELGYTSCAECAEFPNPGDCKKFDNFIGRVIGFVLNSNRAAGIAMIKERGREGFAEYMEGYGRVALKRKWPGG